MQKRQLGSNGPLVSIVAFGAWPIGGGLGSVPETQGIAAVKAALDVGMTFIDTAEGYQTSETVVGKAISGRRDEAFLATKLSGGDHSAAHMAAAVENSLRALGTDHIDLYQLHSPSPAGPSPRRWRTSPACGTPARYATSAYPTSRPRRPKKPCNSPPSTAPSPATT